MKPNHPTPWTISYGKIIAANGLIVCSLPSRKSNDSANLIASAPDLLLALQNICAMIVSPNDTRADILAHALSAISKAEGVK